MAIQTCHRKLTFVCFLTPKDSLLGFGNCGHGKLPLVSNIGTRALQEWHFDSHFRVSIPSPIPVPESTYSREILMENMENGD